MGWADEVRVLRVRANADTPLDAKIARGFGAEGIGLCRTEYMFFDEERIRAVREMILADEVGAREKALAKLLPHQKKDFVDIFREMAGLPVTIRLLDPPLHEFLPHERKQIEELAELLGVTVARVEQRIKDLHEFNRDARAPRLPPRDHLPGDLRDAGARDPRGRRGRRSPRARASTPRS
jgi:pyruvate,orthophosphate dikinase